MTDTGLSELHVSSDNSTFLPDQSGRIRNRNYWSALDPADFMAYPKFDPISYLQEAKLLREAQAGNCDAFSQIWTMHARLAFSVVNRFRIPNSLLEDALQEGVIGLRRAIEKYEIDRYNAFSTYAWFWVKQAIHRFLHRSRYFISVPSHLWGDAHARLRNSESNVRTNAPCNLDALVPLLIPIPINELKPHQHPYAISNIEKQIDLNRFCGLVKMILLQQEYHIIKYRVGLEEAESLTLEQLGTKFKITRERIRQIEVRALDRLRKHLPLHGWNGIDGASDTEMVHPIMELQPTTIDDSQLGKNEELLSPLEDCTGSHLPADEVLLSILKSFTLRQANSVINYYGLFQRQPLSFSKIQETLDLSERKTYLALVKGRKKLIRYLRQVSHPDLQKLLQVVNNSPIPEVETRPDGSASGEYS